MTWDSTQPCAKHEMIGCTICKPKPVHLPRAGLRRGLHVERVVTTAEYNSTCEACGDPIHEGDEITFSDNQENWVHVDCS